MTEGGEDARGEKGGCRTAFRIGTIEGGEDARGKEVAVYVLDVWGWR